MDGEVQPCIGIRFLLTAVGPGIEADKMRNRPEPGIDLSPRESIKA